MKDAPFVAALWRALNYHLEVTWVVLGGCGGNTRGALTLQLLSLLDNTGGKGHGVGEGGGRSLHRFYLFVLEWTTGVDRCA